MKSEEIRKLFFGFFKERGHTIVPSSSLIPDDPSVLLTTAGMQQFKRYFTGELDPMKDFGSRNTASIQKSFRTSDIEEVGDESHLTFFEMLGNFSFGGYWKDEAIKLGWEFLVEGLGVSPDRMHVTVHESASLGLDKESYAIWHKKIGLPEEKIKTGGIDDNFWGPTGSGGPCGPTTEIYVDGIEVWNIVFNEFYSKTSREDAYKNGWKMEDLKIKGIDTGMGFERLVAVMQGVKNVFETDLLYPIVSKIRELAPNLPERVQRIFTDHFRAAAFLVADGLRPSNKEAGYILRRHLRRILAYQIKYDVHADLIPELVSLISGKYSEFYPELRTAKEITAVFEDERFRFEKAVKQGILEIESLRSKGEKIDAKKAFYLYETLGLPFELVKELVPKELAGNLKKEEFEAEFRKHQEISRAGQEKKFGGHGLILDTGELKAGNEEDLRKVTRLHTATHLLHQALRDVLGDTVKQMGSDITTERTRFDFSFPRKLTDEEKRKVEEIVNKKVKEDLPVSFKELPKAEAERTGALHFFKLKYPESVKVYFVGKSLEAAYSKEFCGGPHVTHTSEIGKFRIAKEEAVAAGVRRIRGVVD